MSESKVWSKTGAPGDSGAIVSRKVLSGGGETGRRAGKQTFIENFRLIVGFSMLIAGLYFGVFSTGIGVSLGFLSFMTSPFVMVTDK